MGKSAEKLIKPSTHSCGHCESRQTGALCRTSDKVREIIDRVKLTQSFTPGQTIFYEGGDALGLFLIEEGLVKLESHSIKGGTHTLRLMTNGGVLGYRALFAQETYKASAVCVEPTKLCFIPKADLMMVIQQHPETALNLLEYISKDLGSAENKWLDQMEKGAPERIAAALLFFEAKFGDLDWTRKEIAQWAGTTPETVIRTLSSFEKDGLISQIERKIRILHREKLVNMTAIIY